MVIVRVPSVLGRQVGFTLKVSAWTRKLCRDRAIILLLINTWKSLLAVGAIAAEADMAAVAALAAGALLESGAVMATRPVGKVGSGKINRSTVVMVRSRVQFPTKNSSPYIIPPRKRPIPGENEGTATLPQIQ